MRPALAVGSLAGTLGGVLIVLDLDGVVWLAGRPIPGAPEAVGRLRDAGHRVVFVTNNSGPTLDEHVEALDLAGVAATPNEVVSSAGAAAALIEVGSTAAVVGGAGIFEALEGRGVRTVGLDEGPETIVVGRSPELDYEELAAAANAIRSGARFVATNTDATFPTPTGLLPGAGAVIAYLRVASGVEPEVAGKPHRAVADLVLNRFGSVGLMVGDRLDTDGLFAERVGAPFGLVLSGVTRPGELTSEPAPALIAPDLAHLVGEVLGSQVG